MVHQKEENQKIKEMEDLLDKKLSSTLFTSEGIMTKLDKLKSEHSNTINRLTKMLETSYDGKDVLYISGGKNLQLFSIRGCYDDSCKPNINDCNFSSS